MSKDLTAAAERAWLELSLAQQSVWLDAKLSGTSDYQLGGWARVAAPLDEATVRQSVRLLTARHDALRLRVDDDLPRQWLDASTEPPIAIVDLASSVNGFDASDPDAAFRIYVDRVFALPMPLGDHPLFGIDLLLAGPNLHYVLWRFHHLIADSLSVSIALSHWFEAYEALTSTAPGELAPASSYLKTIAADGAYLESAAYHQNLAYWADRFDPMPPPLIADMEMRPTIQGLHQAPGSAFTLSGDAFAGIQRAAKAAGTTAQRALFALFALTLGRRYSQSDIVSGVALHRRDLSNRDTLGMMAGVIAVRCDFDPFWSLQECVQAFSEQVDADLRHQRLPIDVLSRALGLSGTGRTGLFEAVMSFLPARQGQGTSLVGLPIAIGMVETKEASPISLHVTELPDNRGFDVRIAVNTDFLEATEGATLASLLQSALGRFVSEPDSRFEELESITPDEREMVVERWNQTDARFEDGTLDGLFSAQAGREPNAIAVVDVDGRELSYAELDAQSTHLARQLVAGGVKSECVVGVRMVRSAETIISLLAILKAGGAYLPLDPAYPSERLDYMASDADAMLVLDSINFLGDAKATLPSLPKLSGAGRLAYVIYTSGTTGRPKGVAVNHAAAVNLAFARRACHDPIGVGDRVLAAISVGFDVSIGQLLLPLLSGATVVIAGEVKTMDAAEFWGLLANRQVTHINSVPSFFESILDTAPPAESLRLKRLMLGGEALTGTLVKRIRQTFPGLEIVNMYGPTEACIDATFHPATAADFSSAVLPIGRPLSNYRAYILDAALSPVGLGVTGELYLGGAGLGRGYINAPELTAERFVNDPFPGTTSGTDARLYRTGDRARRRADGEIEFLGRGDAQVKIRGFRVEPGEIAATLLEHPSVAQAIVMPSTSAQSKPGDPTRLVAYVVPRAGDSVPEATSLRSYLAERLPDYMVPSAFVTIAAMPLNHNGKLDVGALPSPDVETGEYVAPRTATEEVVATLFAEVLGLEHCGAHDHFFELGGHSLLATSLISKMRSHGWSMPLRAVFEAPTVEMLARRLDTSLPGAKSSDALTISPRPDDIPLSFSQERIWFVDRLQQDSSYNIPVAFALHGQLDENAAGSAIRQIIGRHETLRTKIVMRGGRPLQEVMNDATLVLERLDLSALDTKSREIELRATLKQLAAHRFDLSVVPPLHMLLIRLADDDHVLAAVIHHVSFDGWSAEIFLREFSMFYAASSHKQPSALKPLALQYADFALWQRQQDRAADLAFWLDELEDAPPQLNLPTLSALSAEGIRFSSTLPFRLDSMLHARLLKLANERGASLFMLLHAAFALLLARLSGQDDVVLGTVNANRTRSEFESLIGCFVNTLPLRTRFREGESFLGLLGRVKSADLAAYAHQDLPFEQLVAALDPDHSLQHTPIFQVMFLLQNAPVSTAQMPGLAVEPIALEAEIAKFDITFSLTEDKDGIAGLIEFAKNKFSASWIGSLANHFKRLLETVAANPEMEATGFDVLDATERSLLLDRWNNTEMPFETGTLHGLFALQACKTPEAIAVVGLNGSELTYNELDAQSSRLARQLQTRGVQPQHVVGVRMERSTETVIALLAILKAGAVYLPLDPAYPVERLDYMVADAGASVMIDSVNVLDEVDAVHHESPSAFPDNPESLAYIIYTSGTTGQPKGVAVTHSAGVNLAFARRAAHDPISTGDRVLAAISVGFDVSIGQLLLPLLSGATVVIAGDLKQMKPAHFWALVTDRRITHINSVPSFLESVLDAVPQAGELVLKRLMLGGEALSGSLVARIRLAIPELEIINMYGPTETCIDATYHIATQADLSAAVLPIGRPLPNYRAYVLDRPMQPVPIGVIGELYLGGRGLARGYLNTPTLTAERFVQDPFSANPEARLYRTGDRARWRADGVIEFLGRMDHQVKIRGFRVEPEEVEQQMRLQPGIREAAVVTRTKNGGMELIAYYTSDRNQTGSATSALRASLGATLPDYMVPSAFVRLDHLPLSLNGKLDRKALPAPGQEDFSVSLYEAPVGMIEQTMALLWADLLQIDRVGRHDNFFELGGHSLLAVALIERMNQQGLPGDIRALFTSPTIAALADVVTHFVPQKKTAQSLPDGCGKITAEMLPLVELTHIQLDRLVASVPGGAANVQDIYPLAPLQEGILFQHRMTSAGDPYLTPFLLAFDNRVLLDSFVQALTLVVQRHDVLRTSMVWEDLDTPVQVVLRQVELPVEELELEEGLTDTASHLLSRFDPAIFRIDLTKAPLLRVVIGWDHAMERWLLLLLTHHLTLDHTSLEILMHELRTLMSDPQAALPQALPYRNFIAQIHLSSHPASRALDKEHEEFFGHLLSDIEEPTAPFGIVEAPTKNNRTIEGHLVVDPVIAHSLRERARAMGVTPASLFHLAWAIVLGHISGRSEVVFGTVLFGRMHRAAGADRAVGMFINTLPMLLRLDDTSVAESVMGVHRLLAELMAREHAPLALAQRASSVPPPTPLFSSLFNYRYSAERSAETDWPGVQMVYAAERTNYPLAMAVDDSSTSFALTALAQGEIDPDQVCRYLHHTLTGLAALLDRTPDAPIHTLQALPPSESAWMLERGRSAHTHFPCGTLEDLFAVQAQAHPGAVAIVGVDGREWTYAELDARSTNLARRFVRFLKAGGSEPVVGVRMERSAETIVAMLAILKAGGVYLPLDPAYPAERLDYMAADADVALVLDSLQPFESDPSPEAALAELPARNDPDRLAYIIHTSGTSGLPKGVAMTHRAAVNLAFARGAAHDPIGAGDRVLASISVGFDVSIGQLLLPLLAGATVVIAGDMKTMGAAEFWSFLVRRRITHVNSVPSFFDSVIDAAPPADTLSLKRLMLGGEALTGALTARIEHAIPGLEIVNMYGPTETCIDATYHVVVDADHSLAVIPIGGPLPNYRAHVLDNRMRPVGAGVIGELYLGGMGLARGYVNAPALTAERFVPDPFSSSPDDRLYRTGDLGRMNPQGEIEFLGRADSQIKIRGFRVEPGEIEAQLRRLDGIREAAILATSAEGGVRLIAYYTGNDGLTPETLRAALAEALPDYMVPAAFVQLPQLPLSPNGKLDRKALPEPAQEAFLTQLYVAPIGEVERRMAALWAGLLKLDRIGRHDNFFELGGHSLLAVTLMERMRQQGLPGDIHTLFSSPTIASLAAASGSASLAASIPANKIILGEAITPESLSLIHLTQSQIDDIADAVPGGVDNIQDIYPLAPLQEGILFQHLMTSGGDPYLTPLLLGFDERSQLDSFLNALDRLMQRHDVLRTSMVWNNVEKPAQVVLRRVALPVDEITLDQSLSVDAAAQLQTRFDPRVFRLDISQAPLLRAMVAYDHANCRWLLLLLTHHLILDHTSLEILVSELRTLMRDPHAILPATLPYRNFIFQTSLTADDEKPWAFFNELLGDVDEPTAPYGMLDVQNSSVPATEGRLTLPADLSRRIRDRARALGVTPASLFHLAWAAVLGHVSGKSDVVFGTVLFGRMRSAAGVDRMVGMFINTLPVRLRLDDTGAAESVKRTHQLLAELMTYEHTPLAHAQRASALPAPAPLFSSLFNYRYNVVEESSPAFSGIDVVRATESTNYPLAMAVDDFGDDFTLIALTQPQADPDCICNYLRYTLTGLVALLEGSPNAPIRTLQVLPETEFDQLVHQWSGAVTPFEKDTLDSLFSKQAMQHPSAIAIVDVDGSELRYAELEDRSNRLCHQIVTRGVKPGTVVGVCMERSAATVVAILAILKAGGVYLPLDPAYPAERLAFMAADAQAMFLLELLESFADTSLGHVPDFAPKPDHDDDRLAYVIYTSGTTGLPKGVAVSHKAAVNLAFARRAAHDPLGPGDRVLAAISVGFDVSIGQLLLPLLAGATVVIAANIKTMDASGFWQLIVERRVTHINSVPSFLDSILDAAPAPEALSLKRLMLGGEALTGPLVARLHRALPNTELVNMYGPTEACIDATYHIASEADHSLAVLPIGRPLPNYRAYILDSQMRPAAVGVAAELYLGGEGLARGYVNAEALTAERFVANPFLPDAGARLYRTGDRARWTKNGIIEFLGRVDEQVKIRGFRVEPSEIETVLKQQPAVREGIVVAQTIDGSVRLIAYYTVDEDDLTLLNHDMLRKALALSLPDYMVPAAFVRLDRLPLSMNGKVDRKALPVPGQEVYASSVYQPPLDEIEQRMAVLWADVLGLDRVGRNDNFFEIGGDSLSAMRLVSALSHAFEFEVPIRSLFQHATLEALASTIRSGVKQNQFGNLVPLRASGAKPRLFVMHGLTGHVFHYMPLVRELGPDQPVFGLQATGLEDGEVAERSIEDMAAAYVDALQNMQPHGPYHLLGYSSGGLLAFEMAQQLKASGGQVAFLALLDTSLPDPRMERTISLETLVVEMANSLGLADMIDPASPPESIPELVGMAHSSGRLPADFLAIHAERMANVFRNTVRTCPDYSVVPWNGSMLLIRATRRPEETESLPDWSSHVTGPLTVVDLPCNHLELVSSEMASQVASAIAHALSDETVSSLPLAYV